MEYEIHPELAGRVRDLSMLEYQQLEANCLNAGRILDDVKVWGEYLMDGRHRIKIATKHGLEYDIQELDLPDMEAAIAWVTENQLGRRNLSEFEQQRMRAEQAKALGDTAAVADMHQVSQRTVQRDVEKHEAMELMAKDMRDRCTKGSIISSRSDWKKYGELTDAQRCAVDQALRDNPNITLREALPLRADNLRPEDFETLNQCDALTNSQKQKLAIGTLTADRKSVSEFAKLPPDKQQLVSSILEDHEIGGLDDAMATYRARGGKLSPADDQRRVDGKVKQLMKQLDTVGVTLGELRSLRQDQSGYKPCMAALQALKETAESWR